MRPSTELSNVDREKHRCKSHRLCICDREPSRIPIRSLNKSGKVKKFVYARILSCIPTSSTKLSNKRTFKFNCCEKIRQSIRKVKYRASRYLTLFSCNKLVCSCNNEARVANYCNYKLSGDIKNPGPLTYVGPKKTIITPYSQSNKLVFGQNARQQCVAMSF